MHKIHTNKETRWNFVARAFWCLLSPFPPKDVITLPSQEAGRKIYKIYLAKPVKLKWNRKCSQVANIMYSSRFYTVFPTHTSVLISHTLFKEKEENRNKLVLRKKTFFFPEQQTGFITVFAFETPVRTIYMSKKNKRTPSSQSPD